MKLNIQLVEEDYVKAQYLHMRPRPVFRWISYFLGALVVVTVMISIIQAIAGHGNFFPPVFLGGCLAYLTFLFAFLMPRRARKTFRQQKALQLPYSFELTDELFIATAEYGGTKLTWDYFRKWKEGKTIFTVYQSDRIMQMIPKRVFTSPEEMAQFCELLTKKIGAACP
jgi:YcxB-like protein